MLGISDSWVSVGAILLCHVVPSVAKHLTQATDRGSGPTRQAGRWPRSAVKHPQWMIRDIRRVHSVENDPAFHVAGNRHTCQVTQGRHHVGESGAAESMAAPNPIAEQNQDAVRTASGGRGPTRTETEKPTKAL